jgi:hypothetical protein
MRFALRGLSHSMQGVLQNGQSAMHPVVGLGWTQCEVQPVHDVQWVGLLVDQHAEECVGKGGQRPFGTSASAALACFALGGKLQGLLGFISGLERGQQTLELCQWDPGRSQKFARLVF